MIALQSDQSYGQAYYSKSSLSIRNYLFINSINNEKRWLLNSNEYLISDTDLLQNASDSENSKTVKAILYQVIKRDTNGDKRLTAKDKLSLGISSVNGENYKEVIKMLDSFLGYRVIDENRALIVYQRGESGYSARLNLTTMSIESETEIPKIRARNSP